MCHIYLNNVSLELPVMGHYSNRLKQAKFVQAFKNKKTGSEISTQRNKHSVKALNDINLEIGINNRVALIGHNGCGKTTLLKLISGIYQGNTGHVDVEGKIGALINTGTNVNPELTGEECVKFFCKINRIKKHKVEEIIENILVFTDLGEFFYLPTRIYSNGMKSRLAAAIATSIDFEILIIDEGIGAGDANFQERLKQRVNSFLERAPILLMASHNQNMLLDFCTSGIVMKKGQIVFRGNVSESLEFHKKN